jgi:hypothetical protein
MVKMSLLQLSHWLIDDKSRLAAVLIFSVPLVVIFLFSQVLQLFHFMVNG